MKPYFSAFYSRGKFIDAELYDISKNSQDEELRKFSAQIQGEILKLIKDSKPEGGAVYFVEAEGEFTKKNGFEGSLTTFSKQEKGHKEFIKWGKDLEKADQKEINRLDKDEIQAENSDESHIDN